MRRTRWLVHPAMVVVILAWGLNFSVIKFTYLGFSPGATGLIRVLLTSLVLVGWCLVSRTALRYPEGKFWAINRAGFWAGGVYMVLFLEGMRTATPALGAIALATVPALATVMSVVAGDDTKSLRLFAGIALGYVGVCIAVLGKGGISQDAGVGTLLVLASAVVWAYSMILYRRLFQDQTPLTVLTLSQPGAAIAMTIYGAGAVVRTDFGAVPTVSWSAMMYLVVVAGALGFAMYYKVLADVGPARASLVQYFVPPTAAIGAWVVLGQPTSWSEWTGLAVVSLAAYIATRSPVSASRSPS